MRAQLELAVTVAEGREVECAQHLASQLRGAHWAILAALAAELVSEHERRVAGSAVVIVAGPDQAAAVLREIARAPR